MDTFHPGKKSFIFAILFAFLSSKNGRNMGAKILNRDIKQRLLMLLPLKARCKVIEFILASSISRGRFLMSTATKPYGHQYDYLTKINNNKCKGYWVVEDSHKFTSRVASVENTANKADLVLYYIHGGGFRMGQPTMYLESYIHIIEYLKKTRNMDVRVFAVQYQMRPEVNYSTTKTDVMNGYRYLIEDLKINPQKVVVAGDSAGGNLTASLMLALRDLNSPDLPQPAGNVCISPWISFDHRRILESKRKFVDCLAQYMFNDEQDHYNYFFDGVKYTDPQSKLEAIRKVSPLHASWENICPTLVTYGSTEVFSDDCEDFISLLQRENVQVDVITREAPHIWLISSPLAPNMEIWEEDCSRLATWCANQVSH